MHQVTLRGISSEIQEKIRQMAKEKHTSINQVIRAIVHKEFEAPADQPRAASLKKLAGGWSREEAEAFQASIRSCEQIDEEMWQ